MAAGTPESNGQVTALLREVAAHKEGAWDRLLKVVYEELHRMASVKMNNEKPGNSLQTTALLHEAYIRLVEGEQDFENRAHFFGAAAQAMARFLIDHARRRDSQKRGGGAPVERLDGSENAMLEPSISVSRDLKITLEELEEALQEMRQDEAYLTAYAVITLRFLTQLSIKETAEVLKISPSTVKREWSWGRVWLYNRLGGE